MSKKWKNKLPSESGFYWIRDYKNNDGSPRVKEIKVEDGEIKINLFGIFNTIREHDDIYFWGPIKLPEYEDQTNSKLQSD